MIIRRSIFTQALPSPETGCPRKNRKGERFKIILPLIKILERDEDDRRCFKIACTNFGRKSSSVSIKFQYSSITIAIKLPLKECCIKAYIYFLKKNIEYIIAEYETKDLEASSVNRSKRNHRNGNRSIFFVPGSFIRDVNLHKSPPIRPAVRRQNRESNGSIRGGAINGIGPTG